MLIKLRHHFAQTLLSVGGLPTVLVLAMLFSLGISIAASPLWTQRLVAVGTLWMAIVTVGLIWDTRTGRKDDERSREAGAFRAALVEQVENCRHLYSHSPDRGITAIRPLLGWAPSFDELTRLLGSVPIPGDLTAYLIWLIAQTRQWHGLVQSDLELLLNKSENDDSNVAIFRWAWRVELDRLQAASCLLQAEAERRGLRDVTDAFPPDANWLPWLAPKPRPPQPPGLAEVTDQAYANAPPWPRDHAYQRCSTEVRGRTANAASTKQWAELLGSMELDRKEENDFSLGKQGTLS